MKTKYRCNECGKMAEVDETIREGWLVGQRNNEALGWLVIRCPDHLTRYAAELVGPAREETEEE